jgi:hypothetical protein
MSRIIDITLLACFVASLACCLYIGDQYGEKNGYDRGQLSVYKSVMGQSVDIMAGINVKDLREARK